MSGLAVWLLNLFAGLWKRPPVLAVLVINLIPAACVLLFGWSALALLLLYWAENVILGVINVFKMVAISLGEGVVSFVLSFIVIPFFIVHYGAFCVAHGALAVFFAGGGLSHGDPFEGVRQVWHDRWNYVAPLLAMTAFHLAAFVQWLRARAWKTTSVDKQMGEPYGRIIVMHITVLFGAFLVAVSGQPAWAVALLAVLKTLFETAGTAKRLDEHGKPKPAKPAFP
jgi:hypothetical protein